EIAQSRRHWLALVQLGQELRTDQPQDLSLALLVPQRLGSFGSLIILKPGQLLLNSLRLFLEPFLGADLLDDFHAGLTFTRLFDSLSLRRVQPFQPGRVALHDFFQTFAGSARLLVKFLIEVNELSASLLWQGEKINGLLADLGHGLGLILQTLQPAAILFPL